MSLFEIDEKREMLRALLRLGQIITPNVITQLSGMVPTEGVEPRFAVFAFVRKHAS